MGYSLEYIRNYMNELDNITGFNSKDIKLAISKRMTKTYAYNQMKWDEPSDIKNRILLNDKMVWSEAILSCGASEKQIKDLIKHEYCHAWADYGENVSFGHKGKFIEYCNKLKCGSSSINKDEELNNLYDKYLNNKINKTNNNKFEYKKIFNNLMSKLKYISENNIRINTLLGKKMIQVSITITEKYPNSKDINYLFDNTVKDVEQILKNNKDIKLNGDINFMVIDGYRKAHINYSHYNIKM